MLSSAGALAPASAPEDDDTVTATASISGLSTAELIERDNAFSAFE